MAKVDWTPAQQDAIDVFGGDVLISAAAGSGKTAVLSQRVLDHIINKNISIDKLLIVTFSNAATNEMRQRIAQKISDQLKENPNDKRLMEQQLLLDSAQISTIHSFCIRILRENFHHVGIAADFKIGDEQKLSILQSNIASDIISNEYGQYDQNHSDQSFVNLVELVSNSKNDNQLKSVMLQLYTFIRNHAFYEDWISSCLDQYNINQPFQQTIWYKILINYITDGINHCNYLLQWLEDVLITSDEAVSEKGMPDINDIGDMLDHISAALSSGNWDNIYNAFQKIKFNRCPALKLDDKELKSQYTKNRTEIKEILTTLSTTVVISTTQQYQEDTQKLLPVIQKLFHMVMTLDQEFTQAKKDENILDFGDLEHYVLKLFYKKENDNYQITNLAKEISSQLQEILIDEYQDTNDTQEKIFYAISNQNRFLVGDVKQCIYRFRQACPENFLQKKNTYTQYDKKSFPAKITLSNNFRTRKETTTLVNFIFQTIMSPTAGEMDYTTEDMLYSTGKFDYNQHIPVQLMIADTTTEKTDTTDTAENSDENQPSKPAFDIKQLEPIMVAKEIKRLLENKTEVEDKGTKRCIRPSDICILLRSRTSISLYYNALKEENLDFWCDTQDGFLVTKEIIPIVSYLKVISNPLLDFELCNVLGSYLYGFSSDDLGKLRINPKISVYKTMLENQSNPLYANFIKDIQLLRNCSGGKNCCEVLQMIYALTSAEHKTLVMTQGLERRNNLRLLLDYSLNFGSGDFSSFLNFLYAMEEHEKDLKPSTSAASNAISIITIHKSKGLEYPVVFLSNTSKDFNIKELSSPLLMHQDMGVSSIFRDNRTLTQHNTLPYCAMQIANKSNLLSEEMRILYVGLTRAKEKLYITATDKNLANMKKYSQTPLENGKASTWVIRSSSSYYKWICSMLSHHSGLCDQLSSQEKNTSIMLDVGGENQTQLNISVTTVDDISLPDSTLTKEFEHKTIFSLDTISKNINWQYQYASATKTPVKYSVTSISKQIDQRYIFSRKPQTVVENQKSSYTPAQRGTLTHKFLQFADYEKCGKNLEQEIQYLVNNQFVSQWEADGVNSEYLKNFFAHDLCHRMITADQCHRELRFMEEITPDEMKTLGMDETFNENIVVQGIVDCVIIEGDQIVVIDYKTDRVQNPQELLDRYSTQLNLYCYLLGKTFGKPVSEKIIYSFTLNQTIAVE